jgi:hypothetical protein
MVVGAEQVPVDEDAVVDVEPAGPGQFDVRGDADADDDHVGASVVPSASSTAGRRRIGAGGPDRGCGDTAAQVNALSSPNRIGTTVNTVRSSRKAWWAAGEWASADGAVVSR